MIENLTIVASKPVRAPKPLLFKGGVGVVAMRQHCSRSELAVGNLTPINF